MPKRCPICELRAGKRGCPGLTGSRWAGRGPSTICASCCGREREATIDCPADCSYLIAAHRYEAERRERPRELAFAKVTIEEELLEDHQPLLVGLTSFLVGQARDHRDVRDAELLAALDALAHGFQTLQSGLYYEQPPRHPVARALYEAAQRYLNQFGEEHQQRAGSSLRPATLLQAAVFLRRLGQLESNRRPLSRRFLRFLAGQLPPSAEAREEPRLIVPGR